MTALETYLKALRDIRLSGGGVKEASYYAAVARLLDDAGKQLRAGHGARRRPFLMIRRSPTEPAAPPAGAAPARPVARIRAAAAASRPWRAR